MTNVMFRNYVILPFRFEALPSKEVFLSNEVGEFEYLSRSSFEDFINHRLDPSTGQYRDLKSRFFLADNNMNAVTDILAVKYRTKKGFLGKFTALHMLVPTLRCNSNCVYCQVSKKDISSKDCDMSKNTAKAVVDTIFKSPSSSIKIEFQGGEPLLNFDIIRFVLDYAEWKNVTARKRLDFVLCSNLTLITEAHLKVFKEHRVNISTSLDGPLDIHNFNRPLQDQSNTYEEVVKKIALCRKYLGQGSVSALMTVTKKSLGNFKLIIDEYVCQKMNMIFLRPLNPFGYAKRDRDKVGYDIDDFIQNYFIAIHYLIELNLKGVFISEGFATLILSRILTPFSTGFVDLQSPAGAGICGVIYNYDGNVYVSDEARMLAAMGDKTFLMGNVLKDSYEEMFDGKFLHLLIDKACLESLPVCARCAFQVYCGADPVRNYSEQGDIVGNRPTSEACKKYKAVFSFFLGLIRKNDPGINRVFWSWINEGH